jgi:hypothetical protein
MAARVKVTDRYDLVNLESATIIASDPALYPEGGLIATWADVILSKAAAPMDSECGPLFRTSAA